MSRRHSIELTVVGFVTIKAFSLTSQLLNPCQGSTVTMFSDDIEQMSVVLTIQLQQTCQDKSPSRVHIRIKYQPKQASLKSVFGCGACSWKWEPVELGLLEKAGESLQQELPAPV